MKEPIIYTHEIHMDADSDVLRCPACGYEYNHPIRVVTNRGGVVDIIEGWEDSPRHIQATPTRRGSSIWLEFICECDHVWAIQFQFHKGQVFTKTLSRGMMRFEDVSEFWRD